MWDYSRVVYAYYADDSLIIVHSPNIMRYPDTPRINRWWRYPADTIVSKALDELGFSLYPEWNEGDIS